MSLFLPAELLSHIGRHVVSLQTLRALACVNRLFHVVFDPLLYQRDAQSLRSASIDWAAKHGMMEILEKALRHGVEVPRYTPAYGFSGVTSMMYGMKTKYHFHKRRLPHPLCLAVENGHVDVAKLLIARGCDVNMKNLSCLSLLCLAVAHGHTCMLKTLLNLGACHDNRTSYNQNSPVQIAAYLGDEAVLELLLYYGSDSNHPTAEQKQDALECAIREGHHHIFKPLLDSGVDLNFSFKDRSMRGLWTPLLWAIEEDVEFVKLFVSGGADLNVESPDGESALLKAVARNNRAMVRVLVGGTNQRRRTHALTRSMDYPDGRIARILLDNGTATDFEESHSETGNLHHGGRKVRVIPPLIQAIILEHSGLVRLLVARGANVNVEYPNRIKSLPDWVCGGPLLLAIKLGNQEIAKFLRCHGAKENVDSI